MVYNFSHKNIIISTTKYYYHYNKFNELWDIYKNTRGRKKLRLSSMSSGEHCPTLMSPMVINRQISPSAAHSTPSQESIGMEAGNVQKEPITFPSSTASWHAKGSSHSSGFPALSSQLVVVIEGWNSGGTHTLVDSGIREFSTQVSLKEQSPSPAQSSTVQKGKTMIPSCVRLRQPSPASHEMSSHVARPPSVVLLSKH